MAQSWPEAILEFFTLLFKIVYFWFEAVVKFVVPHRYFRKDVRGQKVLITGAGTEVVTSKKKKKKKKKKKEKKVNSRA